MSNVIRNLSGFIQNAFISRQSWLNRLIDPRRNIDTECGHPEQILIGDYREMYDRGDIAARVINLYPEECWMENPEIYEIEDAGIVTEFEQSLKAQERKHHLFALMQRADVLSGIGRFGIILIGYKDGKDLKDPVDGLNEETGEFNETAYDPSKLLYLRAFSEDAVSVQTLEGNTKNPRYGYARTYQITFQDNALGLRGSDVDGGKGSTAIEKVVHWSRVIHLADLRVNSDIYGTPRLQRVFNRILDLKKIAGGSGEMFWKGGFPGYSLETQPGLEDVTLDAEATKEEMEEFMNGLQRYIATTGMSVKSLTVQIADPRPHTEVQMQLIATSMGVPWRMFIGSEAAELASSQDSVSWNKKLNRRCGQYITPFLIDPLIERLVKLGCLAKPAEENGFTVEWEDFNSPSDQNKAEVAAKRMEAFSKYVAGGVDLLIPPREFFTLEMDYTDEEAEQIISASEERQVEVEEPEDERKELETERSLEREERSAEIQDESNSALRSRSTS